VLGPGITKEFNLDDALMPVMADPTQLEVAILNLAINARDAMPDGGVLTFSTEKVAIAGEPDLEDGDYIQLTITDTGSGMPPEVVERAFEPFFTTKEVGKGTGLGLSMVFGFVKQSGGHIKIYSEQGHGTTVRIYLPRSTGQGQAIVDTASSPTIERGSETVLVVEDVALVRRYVMAQVASLGYATLEAANAAEALKIVDGADVDLLFTDVIMPGGVSGRELARAVAKRRPGIRVLYTSGYTDNVVVHHGRLDENMEMHFLAKPFSLAQLAEKVKEVLHQRAA
jgi:CheY-like chemotaxis protein